MILTDAGPLVAILDRGEQHHLACVDCLSQLTGPMLTTWPAFTEAMVLLGDAAGWKAQKALWRLIDQADLHIAPQGPDHLPRIQALMHKYRAMDLADASLLVLAEDHDLHDIFTLDHSHFRTYRLHSRHPLRLWPAKL